MKRKIVRKIICFSVCGVLMFSIVNGKMVSAESEDVTMEVKKRYR